MPSVLVPRGDRTGARITVAGRQVWLGTFDTPTLAAAAVARARGRTSFELRTVADLAENWELLDPGVRSEETVRHRRAMVAGFVCAHGRRPLESVTVADAQTWATGRPGSVRYLRSMFETAVRLEVLERNVWRLVRLPERSGGRQAFTESEVGALAVAAIQEWPGGFGRHVADMIRVAAYTGLRLGEVANLHVSDVRGPTRLYVRDGKGSKSRLVAVFGPARTILPTLAGGPRRLEDDRLLFRTVRGAKWTRGTVSKMFGAVRERAGVEGTFHSLRHFHGSWLLDQGQSDLDVAVQLGHFDRLGRADATLVRRVYGHPSPARALERLDAVHATEEGSDGSSRGAGAGADGVRLAGAGGSP